MSFSIARGLVAHLIAFTVILQGIELLKMVGQGAILKIWSQANVEKELHDFAPLEVTRWFAQNETFTYLSYALIAIGAVAFIHPSALAFFILFLAHILVCIRFRGSLNGGSDAMTATVLLGAWISFLFKKESFASAGLIWIAVNLLLSYGRAGLAKVQHAEWKDGRALPAFLQQSFYEDVRALGSRLSPELATKLGWGVIATEFALVASPLAPMQILNGVFFLVVIFHFANFWAFGLNRFFWAWIAAWPSVYFLSGLINRSSAQ